MKASTGIFNLLGMTLPQLQDLCANEGSPRFTAKQLCDWLSKKRVESIFNKFDSEILLRAHS